MQKKEIDEREWQLPGEGFSELSGQIRCVYLIYLEQLHLLVLTESKLGGFTPVWRVLPTVLDEGRRVAINL